MSPSPRLPPGQQLVAPGKWPPIGEREPRQDSAPWTVTVAGLVARPRVFSWEELRAFSPVARSIDIHCVTRWSRLEMPFRGVPLAELLANCMPLPDARYVSFVARSERAHSTSLKLDDVWQLDALVALDCEDSPISTLHGGPVRVIVPGRYFYKSLKWLERIELLAEDRLGYWEQQAGYHNTADPWQEQRYMAPQLDRQQVQRLLVARDFTSLDLRGLAAADHDLSGLQAPGALLRDANFRRANLAGANFTGANLSNAHFADANLQGASLVKSDLEGADFSSADLRRADFRGTMLTAATFDSARIDRSTLFLPQSLEELLPVQAAYVRKLLGW